MQSEPTHPVTAEVCSCQIQAPATAEIGCQTDIVIPVTRPALRTVWAATDDITLKSHVLRDHGYFNFKLPTPPEDTSAAEVHEAEPHEAGPTEEEELQESDDNTDKDEDYVPEDEEDDDEEDPDDATESILKIPRIYMVFWEQLKELFRVCHECSKGLNVEPLVKICGFAMTVTTECVDGHTFKWTSHPTVGGLYEGNLAIPSAIFLTGGSFTSFAELCLSADIAHLSTRECSNLQKAYMIPEVNSMWEKHHEGLLAAVDDTPIIAAGDARCDSPGHNATYGTYTIMDTATQYILAQETVRVTDDDIANSYWLEPEGFERCLKTLEVGFMLQTITDCEKCVLF